MVDPCLDVLGLPGELPLPRERCEELDGPLDIGWLEGALSLRLVREVPVFGDGGAEWDCPDPDASPCPD